MPSERYRRPNGRDLGQRPLPGKAVATAKSPKLAPVVIKFWKPYDVLTKFTDEGGRSTLADFISLPDVYPVGRLDRDSEGLLLLTNDGALAHHLTDPRHGHTKIYLAQVERTPTAEALRALRSGLVLSDGPTRPALAELVDEPASIGPRNPPIRYRANIETAWIRLTITEGRNRQVRRMTAAVGFPTLRLIRTEFSGTDLAGLAPGEWVNLGQNELRNLTISRR